jgi:hypothetical protein
MIHAALSMFQEAQAMSEQEQEASAVLYIMYSIQHLRAHLGSVAVGVTSGNVMTDPQCKASSRLKLANSDCHQ